MKCLVVLGTRPEAIKLAPVILEAAKRPGLKVQVCSTGQHREMLHPMLKTFSIVPDYELDVMGGANYLMSPLLFYLQLPKS